MLRVAWAPDGALLASGAPPGSTPEAPFACTARVCVASCWIVDDSCSLLFITSLHKGLVSAMITKQSCHSFADHIIAICAIASRHCFLRLALRCSSTCCSALGECLMCCIAGGCAASADTSVRLWRAPGAEDGAHAAAAYGAEEVAVLEVGSGLSSDVRVSACE